MYWYMDHTGSSTIDSIIPSGIVSCVLWEAQPRFSSKVRAVINAGVQVAVISPKHMTNEECQKYYNDRIRTITQDALKQEEELFYRPVPGLATGSCLFPYPQQGQVSDLTAVTVTGYFFNEGQHMIYYNVGAVTSKQSSSPL